MNSNRTIADTLVMKKLAIVFLMLLSSAAFADELYKANATASYYADKFHGKKTSSGETFNMYAFTAAHKTLPFGTMLRVTNLENGKSVDVRVNDRGPFSESREIDVSKAAAEKLGMLGKGTAQVSLEILQLGGADSTTETSKAAVEKKFPELTPNKRWDIQLGAYSKRENAEVTAQKLVDAGFKNVVFQRTSEITRVVIKDVPTENVQDTLAELESKGFSDYFVRERKVESTTSSPASTIDAK